MSAENPAVVSFLYRFKRSNGTVKEFDIALDAKTLNVIGANPEPLPEWTRLSHHQCANCPLKEAETPRCPVAVNLVGVMAAFNDCSSLETAEVEIETESRRSSKTLPLVDGIRSMIGLYMAASGCPVLDRLKPLVRTHLPFSTLEETATRMVGAYLIAQFFAAKKGGKPDWEMKDLVAFYGQINIVNRSFCQRLRSGSPEDATLNAIVELDNLANVTSIFLKMEKTDKLQALLAPDLGVVLPAGAAPK